MLGHVWAQSPQGPRIAVSGLRFLPLTSSSHYKHIAFLVPGVLRSLPIVHSESQTEEGDKQAMRRKANRKMQLFRATERTSDDPRSAGYSARICHQPAARPQLSPPVSGCSLLGVQRSQV